MKTETSQGLSYPILLFFHGGGWVTDSVENYDRVCSRMAQDTGHIVISVEYRLAPEHRFPIGLEDCYAAARTLYMDLLREIRTRSLLWETVPEEIWLWPVCRRRKSEERFRAVFFCIR